MRARLMDTTEDYARLHTNPDHVEVWEDGRRNGDSPGHWEWWYFDAILDDGSAVVIQFFAKGFPSLNVDGLHPMGMIKVTRPDGTAEARQFTAPVEQGSFGTERCDVHVGPHSFVGDLRDYDIHIDTLDGLGADIHLHRLAQPYRPGTAWFGFGDHDEEVFTWLCAVPKGEVSGTITLDGHTVEVSGAGYHDHQWGSNAYLRLFNHWTWARQRYDDYTVVLFDLIASQPYDYRRFPLFFIQDAQGNLIFNNTHDVDYEVLENHHDATSGKDFPQKVRYQFTHDGQQVSYVLTANSLIESNRMNDIFPPDVAAQVAEVHPDQRGTYTRYLATGDLVIHDGTETIERSDQLIYEFMYPAATYLDHI